MDTDTLRGHAWKGSGFNNCVRMERHFTFKNDLGNFIVLGGGWAGSSVSPRGGFAYGTTAASLESTERDIWVNYDNVTHVPDTRYRLAKHRNHKG